MIASSALKPHPQYADLHYGAHRKLPTEVGVPALVRHLAFWIPDEFAFNHAAWKESIDTFLYRLFINLWDNGFIRSISDLTPNVDDRLIPCKIFLFDNIINLKYRVLEHNASDIQLSDDDQIILYKFCWHDLQVTLRFSLHTEYFTISIFIDASCASPYLPEYQDSKFCSIFRTLSFDQKSHDDYKSLNDFLYHTIWDELEKIILNSKIFHNMDRLGYIFTDFRGLVAAGDNAACAEHIRFKEPFSTRRVLGYRPSIDSSATSRPFYPWAMQIFEHFWPLFTAERRVDFVNAEYTVSGMLHGQVLYASALGVQPTSAWRTPEKHFPLLYFIYDETDNVLQMGRLIDQINHLGTVRIAAIMEIENLRKAGVQLRKVEREIDDILNTVRDVDAANLDPLLDDVAQVKNCVPGGLQYRIERSRHYVQQFHEGVDVLGLKAVDGFQRYDQFVSHRMGSAFDFIHQLGLRYERTIKDVSVIQQYAQQKTQSAILSSIDRRNEKVQQIQEWGEFLLICFLVPYYLSSTLSHIFAVPSHEWLELQIWPVFTAICVIIAVIRIKNREHDRTFPEVLKHNWVWMSLIILTLVYGSEAWRNPNYLPHFEAGFVPPDSSCWEHWMGY